MRALLFLLCSLVSSSALADDSEKLLGNWKLISFYTEDLQTKQRNNVYGDHPHGFAGITPSRFFAFTAADGRTAPLTPEEQAAAYRTLIAYTGKWGVEGDKFVTKVDVASNPAWVGTEQVRFWRFEGDELIITSTPVSIPDPKGPDRMMVGYLVWEREQ
jgi:hypothetical protein